MSLTCYRRRRKIWWVFNLVQVEKVPQRSWWCLEIFVPNRIFYHLRLFAAVLRSEVEGMNSIVTEGMSERENRIRIHASSKRFNVSAVDVLYLLGVIDVIRGDRKRLQDKLCNKGLCDRCVNDGVCQCECGGHK